MPDKPAPRDPNARPDRLVDRSPRPGCGYIAPAEREPQRPRETEGKGGNTNPPEKK